MRTDPGTRAPATTPPAPTATIDPHVLAAVRASMLKDAERWHDSYINHSATALRRHAVAATNGNR